MREDDKEGVSDGEAQLEEEEGLEIYRRLVRQKEEEDQVKEEDKEG